jgi:hypothetical protein
LPVVPTVVRPALEIDQGLEPFDLQCTEDHSSGAGRPSGYALCHLSYVGVSV